MKLSVSPDHSVKVWMSANDTRRWASRAGSSWPCSTIAGRALFAEFAGNGDLVDLRLDYGRGSQDVDAHELNAIAADHLWYRLPDNHPALARFKP